MQYSYCNLKNKIILKGHNSDAKIVVSAKRHVKAAVGCLTKTVLDIKNFLCWKIQFFSLTKNIVTKIYVSILISCQCQIPFVIDNVLSLSVSAEITFVIATG